MPNKIVLVSGVGNSGKTTSIRRYLNIENVFHLRRMRDITMVFRSARGRVVLGVASGGDTLEIVRRNFRFFEGHDCDVIVCSSKSHGATREFIEGQAAGSRAQLIELNSNRVAARRRAQENERLARRIYTAVYR